MNSYKQKENVMTTATPNKITTTTAVTTVPAVANSTSSIIATSEGREYKDFAKFNPLDPIGSILDECLKDVRETLDKVGDVAKGIIAEAGLEITNIIAGLKVAYDDSLQKTYDAVDKTMRINIDRVRELVKDIVDQNMPALEKLADRIADIVKFSPLSNWWLPLLDRVEPQFCAVSKDPTLVTFKFTGNFAYADRPDYPVKFNFNGQDYAPTANTTKELKFKVQVPGNDDTTLHKCSYLGGTLSVMWKSGYFFGTTTSAYNCLLAELPGSPGTITSYITKAATIVTTPYISQELEVVRNRDHWTTHEFQFTPAPGWLVQRGTSYFVWSNHRDQIGYEFISDTNNTVTYHVSVKDGWGKFKVGFSAYKDVPSTNRQDVKTDLRWGSDYIIKTEPTERITQIVLDTFNGDTVIYQPATDEHSSPFIALKEFEDGTIRVRAKHPEEINPNFDVKNTAPKNIFKKLNEKVTFARGTDKDNKLQDDNNNNNNAKDSISGKSEK
jgi:hypothetical protein